jgi:hypothetical protein
MKLTEQKVYLCELSRHDIKQALDFGLHIRRPIEYNDMDTNHNN